MRNIYLTLAAFITMLGLSGCFDDLFKDPGYDCLGGYSCVEVDKDGEYSTLSDCVSGCGSSGGGGTEHPIAGKWAVASGNIDITFCDNANRTGTLHYADANNSGSCTQGSVTSFTWSTGNGMLTLNYTGMSICGEPQGTPANDAPQSYTLSGNTLQWANATWTRQGSGNCSGGGGGGGGGGGSTGYNCVSGNCNYVSSGANYSTLSACQSACAPSTGQLLVWSSNSQPCPAGAGVTISVYINNSYAGGLSHYWESAPNCGAQDAVTQTLSPGTHSIRAECGTNTWGPFSINVVAGQCSKFELQ